MSLPWKTYKSSNKVIQWPNEIRESVSSSKGCSFHAFFINCCFRSLAFHTKNVADSQLLAHRCYLGPELDASLDSQCQRVPSPILRAAFPSLEFHPVRTPPEAGALRTLDLTGPPHEEAPACGAPSSEAGASTKLWRGSEEPA